MLDKKRPYGTVCGVPTTPGLKYQQDGKDFNSEFLEIDSKGNVIEPVLVKINADEIHEMNKVSSEQARPPVTPQAPVEPKVGTGKPGPGRPPGQKRHWIGRGGKE